MAQKPIGLRMDPALIERIDAAKGNDSRATFITRAVEAALESRGGSGSAQAPKNPSSSFGAPAPPRGSDDRSAYAVSKAGCRRHPLAGATQARGAWWCAEPGCMNRAIEVGP